MNKLLLDLRNLYYQKSKIIISVLIVVVTLIYFLPSYLYFDSWNTNVGGFFIGLLHISTLLSKEGLFILIFACILYILMIIILIVSYKKPKLIPLCIPGLLFYFGFMVYMNDAIFKYIAPIARFYDVYYMLFLLSAIIFVLVLSFSIFLPLKTNRENQPGPAETPELESFSKSEKQTGIIKFIKKHKLRLLSLTLLVCVVLFYFIPFNTYKSSNGEIYSFSLLDNFVESSRYIATLIYNPDYFYQLVSPDFFPDVVTIPILVLCTYVVSVILAIIISCLCEKHNKLMFLYYLLFANIITYCACCNYGDSNNVYPVAIFALIVLCLYTLLLLSPMFSPKLKLKTRLCFEKIQNNRKPTKSERIAELERQVAELKSEPNEQDSE